MVDWKELERLSKLALDLSVNKVIRYDAKQDLKDGLYAQFPAILSQRREMLAKLEAAQRLRDAVAHHKNEVGDIPVKSIDDPLYAALAAFDKETE